MLRSIGSFFKHLLTAVATIAVVGLILLIAIIAILIHACSYHGYDGDHPDLYTVAVNNVFGIDGKYSNGEVTKNPRIEVIETDDYGRTLFFYNELYGTQIEYGMAFVISQKTEDGFVYYYQDDCYLPYFDSEHDLDVIMENIDRGVIEMLKERNDWNMELNESKCTKSEFTKEKPKGKVDTFSIEHDKKIEEYAKANGVDESATVNSSYFKFCNSDYEGKELFYVSGNIMKTDENGKTISESFVYAVIFGADGNIVENGIVEIKNPRTSHELIKTLKEQTGWIYGK